MFKKFIFISFLAVGFISCEKEETTDTPDPDPNDPTEITYNKLEYKVSCSRPEIEITYTKLNLEDTTFTLESTQTEWSKIIQVPSSTVKKEFRLKIDGCCLKDDMLEYHIYRNDITNKLDPYGPVGSSTASFSADNMRTFSTSADLY